MAASGGDEGNNLRDGTYNDNRGNPAFAVSNGVISGLSTILDYRYADIPFKRPFNLHVGDIVVFGVKRVTGDANNASFAVGFNGNTLNGDRNYSPFRATPIARTCTIETDMTVQALYLGTGSVWKTHTLEPSITVNGVEVLE